MPTHYHGLFYMQPSSARATGMGLTTITLGGIENSFYNPASIGLVEEDLEVHLNYSYGSQVYKGGQFPFAGATFRLGDKLRIGASTFHWIDQKNSFWTTIVGRFNENVTRRSQSAYNLIASYEIISGLHLGLAGNFLVDRSVDDAITNREQLLSAGAVYDLNLDKIKSDMIQNSKLRFAGSFVNLLMKNRIEQTYEEHLHYRDLPIHLNLGAAYHFSVPLKTSFLAGVKPFEGGKRMIDASVNLQFRDVLKGPDKTVVNENHMSNSSIGIGVEAWCMDLLALRMGYYFEKRPSGDDPFGGYWATGNKKGFTFGLGGKMPWDRWSNGDIPLNAEVNLVVSKLLDEFGKTYTPPAYFTEKQLLFAIGVNIKRVRKKAADKP